MRAFSSNVVRLGRASTNTTQALLRRRATQETEAFYGAGLAPASTNSIVPDPSTQAKSPQAPSIIHPSVPQANGSGPEQPKMVKHISLVPNYAESFDAPQAGPSDRSDINAPAPHAPLPPNNANEKVFLVHPGRKDASLNSLCIETSGLPAPIEVSEGSREDLSSESPTHVQWSELIDSLPHDALYGERADVGRMLGEQQLFEQVRFSTKESLDAKHNWASPLSMAKAEELRDAVRVERIIGGTGADAADVVAARGNDGLTSVNLL